jgi:acyl carrier protein
MNQAEQLLRTYIVKEILDGEDNGLDRDTPLLEWGLLNSMEMTRLIGFIGGQLGVQIPAAEVFPENFVSIGAIASLVERLRGA